MNNKLKHLLEHLIIAIIGGFLYLVVEILWRNETHWTMFIVGAICFAIIDSLNDCVPWSISVIGQMVLSSFVVTFIEFISGCIINLGLNWNVWNYSLMPYNLCGQICLLYTNLWFLLALPCIIVGDWLRLKLFNEPIQKYKWL